MWDEWPSWDLQRKMAISENTIMFLNEKCEQTHEEKKKKEIGSTRT